MGITRYAKASLGGIQSLRKTGSVLFSSRTMVIGYHQLVRRLLELCIEHSYKTLFLCLEYLFSIESVTVTFLSLVPKNR